MTRPLFSAPARWLLVCGGALLGFAPLGASAITIDQTADKDIWIYRHSTTGTGDNVTVFGAISSPASDNRAGQFFTSFETGESVPVGLGAAAYSITSVKIILTLSVSIQYDPTYDTIDKYNSTGGQAGGDDPGRPVEMYGAGYRGGFTASTVPNNITYGPANRTTDRGTRYVYATDFVGGTSLNGPSRDVSNNVTGLGAITPFNSKPFAVGKVDTSDPFEYDPDSNTAQALAVMTFTLDLQNADLVNYLKQSLDLGFLNLITTSLFAADFMGTSGGSPTFYTTESFLDAPRIEMEVQVVPEPGSLTLLLGGLGFFAGCTRRVRRS